MENLTSVESDGVKLWVLLRGFEQEKPVLVINHGGPGSTLMPFSEAFDSELLKSFSVVHWDQRGAGRSYDEKVFSQDFTTHQFVKDTKVVIDFVKAKAKGRKIYLMGHSWGSLIGLKFAAAYPRLIDGYIGVGQLIDDNKGQTLGYRFAKQRAEKASDSDAIRTLAELGNPPFSDFDRRMKLSNLVMKFGGIFSSVSMEKLEQAMSTTSVYAETDLKNQEVGMRKSIDRLSSELLTFHALTEVKVLDVPVLFIQGRDDQATPGELVEEFVQKLEVKRGKNLIWMNKCGHFPFWDEPTKFAEILISEFGLRK